MQTYEITSDFSQEQPSIVRVLRYILPMLGGDIDFASSIHQWFSGLPHVLVVEIGTRLVVLPTPYLR